LAHGIARLVDHTHFCKIIHRDIKSPNVLVANKVVYLIDYGMCVLPNASYDPNQGVGTFRWLAPECMEPPREYSYASDVYSMGLVFWEIASRTVPFPRCSDHAILLVGVVDKGERPEIPRLCPLEYSCIFVDCWHQSPGSRPSTKTVLVRLSVLCLETPPSPLYRWFYPPYDVGYAELMDVAERYKTTYGKSSIASFVEHTMTKFQVATTTGPLQEVLQQLCTISEVRLLIGTRLAMEGDIRTMISKLREKMSPATNSISRSDFTKLLREVGGICGKLHAFVDHNNTGNVGFNEFVCMAIVLVVFEWSLGLAFPSLLHKVHWLENGIIICGWECAKRAVEYVIKDKQLLAQVTQKMAERQAKFKQSNGREEQICFSDYMEVALQI